MAYAEVVLHHFHAPRNNHVMASPDVVGVAGQPGYGPFLVLYLRLEGDRVADASFQTHGCAPSIAAGSLLATELPGSTLVEATTRWTEAAIDEALARAAAIASSRGLGLDSPVASPASEGHQKESSH